MEALDVEAEPPSPFPQVRVLQAPLVGEERVVHGPERVLRVGGLGGVGGGPGARVGGPDGEVAEAGPDGGGGEPLLERRAERALEVGVDEDDGGAPRAAHVVVRPGR